MERRTPLVAQKSANSCEGVLAAAVAVEDDACGGFAGHECGGEGLDDQGGAQVVGDGVADHLAGVQVDHGRGVDPALDGAYVGDVSAPVGVGLGGGEVLSDQVWASMGRWPATVVFFQARGWRPRRPAAFIRRQTRLAATRTPRMTSSAQIRRTPGWPCRSWWISRIVLVSSASVRSRSHGPSARHR